VVILIQSMAFAAFAEAEALNPRFRAGHAKLRLTVDAEPLPDLPDQALQARLEGSFPGLARHHCQVQDAAARRPARARGVVLVEGETTANQAHLLEHLLLEMLSSLDHVPRLSGVTCAYTTPPERNDIFVECADRESGELAAHIAVRAMNAVLAGEPPLPLYPDVLRCARLMRRHASHAWPAPRLARAARIPTGRAEAALEVLAHVEFVEREAFAMNFSGEPHYSFVGAGSARRR
jgi:hypothetical protein